MPGARLLSDAQAGDLVVNGETMLPGTVEQWLKANLPEELASLRADVLEGPADSNVILRERLLDLLSTHHLIRIMDVAAQLGLSESAILRYVQAQNSSIGYLAGPPAVIFQIIVDAGVHLDPGRRAVHVESRVLSEQNQSRDSGR
jgi:hypothetical protein